MRTRSASKVSRKSPSRWCTDGVLIKESDKGRLPNLETIYPDWQQHGVEIEVGSGKGAFLISRGKAATNKKLLGIEYARPYASYSADKIRGNKLENIKIMSTDAEKYIRDQVPDNSLSKLHIYFPDPWHKRRHHRRRLIKPEFILDAHRALRTGGLLLIVSDHHEYFKRIKRTLNDFPGFANIEFPQDLAEGECLVGTNFEKKYRIEGRPIYDIARIKYEIPASRKINLPSIGVLSQ